MLNQKTRFTVLLFFTLLMSACVSLPKVEAPTFEYKRHYISDIDKKKVTVLIELEAYNPNNFGVNDVNFQYQVELKNRKLATGANNRISLEPSQTSRLTVPVILYFKDIQRGLENVLKNIILDTRKIEATISIQVTNATVMTDSGWEIGVPIRYEKTIDQEIPLPKRKDVVQKLEDEAEKLKKKLKVLF